LSDTEREKRNSKITEEIVRRLVTKGFMIDFAPRVGGDEVIGQGKFFRCVVNVLTKTETVQALVDAVLEVGAEVVARLRGGVVNTPPVGQSVLGGSAPVKNNPAEQGHGPVAHRY